MATAPIRPTTALILADMGRVSIAFAFLDLSTYSVPV
jgi:hypothetical protein